MRLYLDKGDTKLTEWTEEEGVYPGITKEGIWEVGPESEIGAGSLVYEKELQNTA